MDSAVYREIKAKTLEKTIDFTATSGKRIKVIAKKATDKVVETKSLFSMYIKESVKKEDKKLFDQEILKVVKAKCKYNYLPLNHSCL